MIDTQSITYRKAGDKDLPPICNLLKEAELPTSDIKEGAQEFIVAEEGRRLVGVIGLETYHDTGLLRSMTVSTEYRNAGIASQLVEQLLNYAQEKRIQDIYLVTNTAENFFERKGFRKISRKEVDEKLRGSTELNGLCPASAVIMKKPLEGQ